MTTKYPDQLERGDVLGVIPRKVVDSVEPYRSGDGHDHCPGIPSIDRIIRFTDGTGMSAESDTPLIVKV